MSLIGYAEFIAACLDAEVIDTPERFEDNYVLAYRIMDDPLVSARIDALNRAWWATNPFANIRTKIDEDLVLPAIPDFAAEVAYSLSRADKLALRKRIFRS